MKRNLIFSIFVFVILATLVLIKFNINPELKISSGAFTGSESGIVEQQVEDVVAPEIKTVDVSTNTFIHKKYNFSFNYPSEFKTSNFNEGGGEQILFNSINGDWFQIYITPWDEEETITSERIKKDLPSMVINSPQNAILGPRQKDGVGPHALIFFSKDSSLGETREVWYVMNGSLYQITTYKRLDAMIGKVLSTLVFN